MHAAWKNDGAIIKLLLERGADPMAADINGDTALHTAAEYVTDRQVLDLFFRDCNVDVPNKAGQMPLFIAMKFKNAPLIELLSACKTKGMKGTTKEMSHKQSHGYRVQRGV
jgi:ankyrin repeat protein